MEDADQALFPSSSKVDTVDLRNRMKSRNATTSRKGLPTFTASEDYLTIRDQTYVQENDNAVVFRHSSSVTDVVSMMEKHSAKTPE